MPACYAFNYLGLDITEWADMAYRSIKKVVLILQFFVITTHRLETTTVIFDFDGVLAQRNMLSFLWQIGPTNLIGLYNPFSLEETLMRFLDAVEPWDGVSPKIVHNGVTLPQIVYNWQCGTTTSTSIKAQLADGFKKYKDIFATRWQRYAIKASTDIIFDPARLARTIFPIKEGVKLLKKCYKKIDEYGNKANKIYILSNFDAETFNVLTHRDNFRRIFALCDGIVISAHVGLAKPNPAIFEYLFNLYSINSDEELIVIIDDQIANINAAVGLHKKNLHAVQCKHLNYGPVKKVLKKLNII